MADRKTYKNVIEWPCGHPTFIEWIKCPQCEIKRLHKRNEWLQTVVDAARYFKDATDRVRLTAIDNVLEAGISTEQSRANIVDGGGGGFSNISWEVQEDVGGKVPIPVLLRHLRLASKDDMAVHDRRTKDGYIHYIPYGFQQHEAADEIERLEAKAKRLENANKTAHHYLMNLQPHIAQLDKKDRPFIDPHVDLAMEVLERGVTPHDGQ